MDYSAARKAGYKRAFVKFFLSLPGDKRDIDELEITANSLLKGCEFHFMESVRRVKVASGVIPFEMRDDFHSRAMGLMKIASMEEFDLAANALLNDYPSIRNWISWWRNPENASMIFLSHRTMDPELWKALPNTTNPEEALHYSLYHHGTKLPFIARAITLHRFASLLEGQLELVIGE